MDGQLAVEVALLGGAADFDDGGDSYHEEDEEKSNAVDQHLQVGLTGDCRGSGGGLWGKQNAMVSNKNWFINLLKNSLFIWFKCYFSIIF